MILKKHCGNIMKIFKVFSDCCCKDFCLNIDTFFFTTQVSIFILLNVLGVLNFFIWKRAMGWAGGRHCSGKMGGSSFMT